MAYAAVISLKQTIDRLLNSSQISILPPSLEYAYHEVFSLQEILQRLDSSSGKRVNALNGQIRDAVYKLEDALESHISNQFQISQSERLGDDEGSSVIPSIELEEEINSFIETAKEMKEECSEEEEEEEEEGEEDGGGGGGGGAEEEAAAAAVAVSSRIDLGGKMVGLSDEFGRVKEMLLDCYSELNIVSVVGMAGIGKTTLAMKIFQDPLILRRFRHLAFVTVGPEYELKEIMLSIVDQMNCDINRRNMLGDEKLADFLYRWLKNRSYLIVLDGIWNIEDWDELKSLLPDDRKATDQRKKKKRKIKRKTYKETAVLLTTRLARVAYYANRDQVHRMRFLNKEESWNLLREKVLAEEFCPSQLEKAGKKIAENCEGLPLAIVRVAHLLSKAEKTPDYWNEVAEKEISVILAADDEMSKVLLLSYKYLPLHLKACFLYMGAFPPRCKIPTSKLIKLWSVEGFLDPLETLEDFAMECLEELAYRSLVLVQQLKSSYGIRTCSLHSVYWHLCVREARKEKFLHVINSYSNTTFTQGIESQRRLCIHNNILFGIKDVYNSMESISAARSLLCTGPYHQYPVPICFGLRLLKILDVVTIRFYKFPIEVLRLLQLRYLALTCNGKLPASISRLWNLQYLIVRRHLSIKCSGAQPYLPMEIWDMQELKHLQVMGSNLPDPCGAFLPNLLTFLDVNAHSCTKGILEKILNLKKLGIQIDLAPDAAADPPLSCFDHLSLLHGLESLKCVIVNPNLRSEVVAPPPPISTFPSGLKSLTLSGFGYPWQGMRIIAQLPKLEVLKLRCFAFRGPQWETCDGEFLRLKFLLLEDTDLVHWRAYCYCFPILERLIVRHCYKLTEIPLRIGETLKMIELVDCPSAVASVKQLQAKKQLEMGKRYDLEVLVHSSWDDDK